MDRSGNPTTVTIDWPDLTEQTVTAVFLPSDVRCMLNIADENGALALDPPPSPNGYPINTTVGLTAYAQSGYAFSHWTGARSGTANPSSILLDSDKSVTAVFNPTVELGTEPSGTGTLILQPEQPAHGYPSGTLVTVRAAAGGGYRFDHWSGDLSGPRNPTSLQVDSPKVIVANFVKSTPFPWWWIVVGLALLLAAVIIGRLVFALATRKATDDESLYL